MSDRYYWVYLPDIDEAGTVVEAESFDHAFKKGVSALCPDVGAEVQIHEIGESHSFVVEIAEAEYLFPYCEGPEDCDAEKLPGTTRCADHTGDDGCAVCPNECEEANGE